MAVQDVIAALTGGNEPQKPLPTLTPESVKRRQLMAMGLMKQGTDTSPVGHWTQGLARVANALVGGIAMRDAEDAASAGQAGISGVVGDITSREMGGGAPLAARAVAAGGPAAPTFAMGNDGSALASYINKARSIESAGNDAAVSPTGATGRYQFTKGTWGDVAAKNPELGLTPDGRLDPAQQEKAMAALTRMNGEALSQNGIPVNPGTLYLAHQQGAAGASALLKNPDAPAAQALAPAYKGDVSAAARAIAVNGGDPSAPAKVFAQKWMSKFGGGGGTQVASADPVQAFAAAAGPEAMVPAVMRGPAPDVGMKTMPDTGAAAGMDPQQATRPVQMAQATPTGAGVDQGNPMVAQVTQMAANPQVQAIAQAHAQTPEGRQMVQQAGKASAEEIYRALNSPWINQNQASVLTMILKKRIDDADPVRQLQMQKLQGEVANIPLTRQQMELNNQKAQAELGMVPLQRQKLQKEIAKSDAPTDVQEFEYGQKTPGFNEWKQGMKKAGAITIDQRAQSAEEQARGSGLGERLNETAKEGAKANEDAATYARFGELLNNVQTGKSTQTLEAVRQMTGIALDPNTDNVQALNAAIQYLAPRLRVPGSGSQSDRELGNFMASIPSLVNTPGGNQKIMETLKGMIEYKQQRAQIAQDWQAGDLSGKEATKRLNELKSPFQLMAEERAKTQATAPKGAPQPGVIEQGYRFKGGNPADPNSWEKVQ